MITLKELAYSDEKLASGHRSCSGCAFPIIARTVLAAAKGNVAVCAATGCLEVTTTIYPYTSWNTPFIHCAFENAASTMTGVVRAYKALKKKGKIKENAKFAVFGGDGGTYDIGLQALSGALERNEEFVYICYDNGAFMNCLSLDSFINTENGLKRITDIKVGEKVYAFDQKDGNLILKKCIGIFDNGMHKVFEVNTLHHSIKATSNHPFLVLKRNGKSKKNDFIWKELKDLKQGDEVVALKNCIEKGSFAFKDIILSKKGDYKVNKINDLIIPKKSSPELMELLGLYVGDGWIRPKKAEIGFALPKGTKGHKRLLELHKKLFDKELKYEDKSYAYIYSINLARFIESLDFGSGAKNKLVPKWVFTIPKEEKEAFIKGLLLSDGYTIGNSHRYVSASFDLLKTLRLLLQTMDYRVGKIHSQTKVKGTHVVYRRLLEDSTYGSICFSKKKKANVSKYINQIKQRNFLADNDFFSTEKIISIKLIKEEPTLDLQVEDAHNFVADGIVVHNTGIQRSSATPKGAYTTTTPAGKIEWRKDLAKIAIAHNIDYVATASPHNLIDLASKAEKAFNCKGSSVLIVLSACPLGWGSKTNETISISKLSAQTNFWPLYEYEKGKYKLSFEPSQRLPIEEFFKTQNRFKHLLKPESKALLKEIQEGIDEKFKELKKLAKE